MSTPYLFCQHEALAYGPPMPLWYGFARCKTEETICPWYGLFDGVSHVLPQDRLQGKIVPISGLVLGRCPGV